MALTEATLREVLCVCSLQEPLPSYRKQEQELLLRSLTVEAKCGGCIVLHKN